VVKAAARAVVQVVARAVVGTDTLA
jgi:hypothetical protein